MIPGHATNLHLFKDEEEPPAIVVHVDERRGVEVLLVHCEAVGGEDLHQRRGHVVGSHAICFQGVHLFLELHMDERSKGGRGHEEGNLEAAISKDILIVTVDLMTHLRGKFKTLVVEIFLLTNQLEAEDIVGVDHVVLQGTLLEGQLSHGLVKTLCKCSCRSESSNKS